MRKLVTVLALVAGATSAVAGDYLTNTNQHVSFLRNPARDASIEIDAVYSNPAGLSFLKREGWQFSINAQSAFQTRQITSSFLPFAGNLDGKSPQGERVFKGEAVAPIVPSAFVAYKRDRWAIGAHIALVGGGGKATFKTGLPSFEAPVSLVPSLLSNAGIPAKGYSVDMHMKGRQYIFGVSLGASYRITDNFSAYLGARVNYVNNHYEGYLRNLSSYITQGGQPQLVNVSQTLSALSQRMSALGATQQAAVLAGYAKATGDIGLNVNQTGWGITPIVSLNYRLGDLHLAAKYEFRTSLKIKNETKENTTGDASFDNGVNTPHDLPAMLSLGATYNILDELRVSVGYHHFYDRQAGMAGGKNRTLKHGTDEYLIGVEGDVTKRLTLSAGAQVTNYGLSDAYQSPLSFSCDSFSVGAGLAYSLTDKVRLNLAYFYTQYQDYTKNSSTYTPKAQGIPGKDVFARTNHVLGLGVDFSL